MKKAETMAYAEKELVEKDGAKEREEKKNVVEIENAQEREKKAEEKNMKAKEKADELILEQAKVEEQQKAIEEQGIKASQTVAERNVELAKNREVSVKESGNEQLAKTAAAQVEDAEKAATEKVIAENEKLKLDILRKQKEEVDERVEKTHLDAAESDKKKKNFKAQNAAAIEQATNERTAKISHVCDMNEPGGWRPVCFETGQKQEFGFIDELTVPWSSWSPHMKSFIVYLMRALGIKIEDNFEDDVTVVLNAVNKFKADNGLTDGKYNEGHSSNPQLLLQAVDHKADPPGCMCSQTWGMVFQKLGYDAVGSIGLNAPDHCTRFLWSAKALQHLMFRFDSAGKIDGKYCKYSKNFVMRVQRQSNLPGTGFADKEAWRELLKQFGDPSAKDTGGILVAGNLETEALAPSPETVVASSFNWPNANVS